MDWQRMLELTILGLVILGLAPAVIASHYSGSKLPRWEVSVPWLIFFGLGAVSSVQAKLPLVALLDWSWNLCWFLATVFLIALMPKSKAVPYKLTTAWIFSSVASYTVFFYVSNWEALFSASSSVAIRFPGFVNVRPFSDYQTAVLFFIPTVIHTLVTNKHWRLFCWLWAGIFVALALASGSRSLVLGQLAGLISISLLLRHRSAEFLRRQLKMWLLGAAFYVLLFLIIPLLLRDTTISVSPSFEFLRAGLSARDVLWQQALSMFLGNPLLGQGPMHFAVLTNRIGASPHNQVLQLLAEWGGPATLLFIWMVGRFMRYAVTAILESAETTNGTSSSFQIAAIAALIALLAQSFVSPVFNNPASQILLSVLVVLCAHGKHEIEPVSQGVLSTRIRRLAIAALAVLIFSSWLVTPWIIRIAERNICYVNHISLGTVPTQPFSPRFWVQGWIFTPCEQE